MPLTLAVIGEENIIKRIGGNADVRAHLQNLGFVSGAVVTVVSSMGGNLIVNVKNARVKKLHGEGAVKRRIMDMGITKGVEIKVQKVAPLGDPMEVTVRGYQLSIRKADAEMVYLKLT